MMGARGRVWDRTWVKGTGVQAESGGRKTAGPPRLYTLQVFLTDGPVAKKFAGKEISRAIQIRGDQTLQVLHKAIFKAFSREEEHFHEFNFGKGPYDQEGPRYTLPSAAKDFMTDEVTAGDVSKTTLDSLGLKVGRAFGYWFDFGDDWRHEIRVEAMGDPPPKGGCFPKVIARVGESPPQYADPEDLE